MQRDIFLKLDKYLDFRIIHVLIFLAESDVEDLNTKFMMMIVMIIMMMIMMMMFNY